MFPLLSPLRRHPFPQSPGEEPPVDPVTAGGETFPKKRPVMFAVEVCLQRVGQGENLLVDGPGKTLAEIPSAKTVQVDRPGDVAEVVFPGVADQGGQLAFLKRIVTFETGMVEQRGVKVLGVDGDSVFPDPQADHGNQLQDFAAYSQAWAGLAGKGRALRREGGLGVLHGDPFHHEHREVGSRRRCRSSSSPKKTRRRCR
jgi:hypothetical protein